MLKVTSNFDANSLRKKLEKEMKQKGAIHIRERLQGIACPDHGTMPTVTDQGLLASGMSWSVHTCCDKLQELVDARLKDSQ